MKTCTRCEQPFDGLTFGPTIRDEWCMACWFDHQDTAVAVKDALSDVDVDDEPTTPEAALAALDEREKELKGQLEDAEAELDEARSLVRSLEHDLDDLDRARAELERLQKAGNRSKRVEALAL
jgi:hypothetical protein